MPFPTTSVTSEPRFQGHGVPTDALGVLSAQLTRDLFAIDKFHIVRNENDLDVETKRVIM